MHITSSQDFDQALIDAGGKLIVVDFFATWCGPCKMIAPKLEELANEYSDSIVVLKVDVDEVQELAEKYNIQSLPTFLFMRGTQIVEQFSGANFDKLKATVNKLK